MKTAGTLDLSMVVQTEMMWVGCLAERKDIQTGCARAVKKAERLGRKRVEARANWMAPRWAG